MKLYNKHVNNSIIRLYTIYQSVKQLHYISNVLKSLTGFFFFYYTCNSIWNILVSRGNIVLEWHVI